MKKVLFTLLGVIACVSFATAQVSLNFNPEKGATYEYTMNMDQKLKQKLMGQEMPMDQKMHTTYTMRVVENNAQGVKVAFSYKKVFYEMSSMMMNMKYDSETADPAAAGIDGILAKVYGGLLGKDFEVMLDKEGTVQSVSGMDEILAAMIESFGNDMQLQQVAQSLQAQFSDEAMKGTFNQSFQMYPGKAVKVGDTWEVKQESDAGGMPMKIKSTYMLKSAGSGKATLDVVSDIDGMDGSLKGTQGGEITMDQKTGLPEKSEIMQNMQGTITTNGMEVEMDIQSTITVTTKKI